MTTEEKAEKAPELCPPRMAEICRDHEARIRAVERGLIWIQAGLALVVIEIPIVLAIGFKLIGR